MPDDHTITSPNLREDADPCTLSHRDETLRARSLDQAQAHQPDPEERSPANHPPRQQKSVFRSSKIVFLPSLTCLLRSQQLQGQGQHYRAPSGRQLGHTTSPVRFAVFRRKAPRELHADEPHAHQLTPRRVQPPRGKVQGTRANCKRPFARLLTALQSLWCHLLAVKQGPEETRDSNHIRLYLVTSFVIYHTDKLFQRSFSASRLHTPAFEIKKFELGLCSYDAEPTAQQQARGKAKASDNSGRR